ncbi:MAG: FmdB family zinc ribbon protein, partial [Planctomycetota bacterium]
DVCSACRHRFERFESIRDDGSKKCPRCGRRRVRRLLGVGAGLIFRGAGFYATDDGRSRGTTSPKGSGKSRRDGQEEKESGR